MDTYYYYPQRIFVLFTFLHTNQLIFDIRFSHLVIPPLWFSLHLTFHTYIALASELSAQRALLNHTISYALYSAQFPA